MFHWEFPWKKPSIRGYPHVWKPPYHYHCGQYHYITRPIQAQQGGKVHGLTASESCLASIQRFWNSPNHGESMGKSGFTMKHKWNDGVNQQICVCKSIYIDIYCVSSHYNYMLCKIILNYIKTLLHQPENSAIIMVENILQFICGNLLHMENILHNQPFFQP